MKKTSASLGFGRNAVRKGWVRFSDAKKLALATADCPAEASAPSKVLGVFLMTLIASLCPHFCWTTTHSLLPSAACGKIIPTTCLDRRSTVPCLLSIRKAQRCGGRGGQARSVSFIRINDDASKATSEQTRINLLSDGIQNNERSEPES